MPLRVRRSVDGLFVLRFPCLYLILVFKQIVDIVETVDKALFLVAVDFKLLALACSEVGDSLVGQVNLYLHLRVLLNALKEFGEELLAHYHRQHEVVEFVVLVDVGKEAADNHAESITGDCPCG